MKVQQSNNTEEAGGMKEFGDTPSEKQDLRPVLDLVTTLIISRTPLAWN